ncbi:hypothetical protein EVAR_48624_1 [Eumeta japonica]|uniref:Uncharacterized protein n=1 Tax=Eumeta variegata TaxID=151549 RepID=A0A4C1XXE5_EUMVA|nr:hypothetical protein EVAR_48624_1 [Eumeta japonica]
MDIPNKLKLLFGKLLEPGYVINNYYSDSLISKLQNADKDFLWKLNDFGDDASIKCVLDFVLEPIINNPYEKVKSIEKEDEFIVAALNLITVTIKKFLPPNLSLLLETTPDSPLNNIGELIYSNMHDINWEIKDSALEMLLVCTEISFIKYTPFQKQIIDNNLIVVAATISLNESEFYVQASALKCLGAATKIRSIWEHLLQAHCNIQENLISIMANNPEGIVRKEATIVLSEMYQNLKLTPAFKKTLYEHMVSAAIADFHWEVQVSALKFWKLVIQNYFTDQGMLDGTFPPVTFSKESRKIITLNQSEIHKILVKILDELANNGCLTVLVKLLQDTDVEIIDSAYQVSSELHNILVKYNVCDIIKSNKEINTSLTDEYMNIQQTVKEYVDLNEVMEEAVEEKSDSVIEGIVNSDDINLLSNIYQHRMRLQNEHGNVVNMEPKIKLEKYVSPLAFIKIMSDNDFNMIIEEKHRWKDGIRSLESLLDDILALKGLSSKVPNNRNTHFQNDVLRCESGCRKRVKKLLDKRGSEEGICPFPTRDMPGTVQRVKLCRSELAMNDILRCYYAPRLFLLLRHVRILCHYNARDELNNDKISCVVPQLDTETIMNSKVMNNESHVKERWKNYLESVFACDDTVTETECMIDDGNEREITTDEIMKALKRMKVGKATRYNKVSSEMLRGGRPYWQVCCINVLLLVKS